MVVNWGTEVRKFPRLVKFFMILFCYRKKYESGELAHPIAPSSNDKNIGTQFKIVRPLVGFVLIVFGSLLQLC